MLTQEILLALLQGLPAAHLDHLDRPWYLLALRLQRALKRGLPPPDALHDALDNSAEWEREAYVHAFRQEDPVLALPDLTPRQKDALIALRTAGACSLSQLSRFLALDRSYTRRLLLALIENGYAIRYFRRDGPYYLAIFSPLSDQHRSESLAVWQAFKQFLIQCQPSSSPNALQPSIESTESIESTKSADSAESAQSRSMSALSPDSSNISQPTPVPYPPRPP